MKSVLCPGFTSDCLETLEEIDQEGVPEAQVAPREAAPDAATVRDDDFPVLELPTGHVEPDREAFQAVPLNADDRRLQRDLPVSGHDGEPERVAPRFGPEYDCPARRRWVAGGH